MSESTYTPSIADRIAEFLNRFIVFTSDAQRDACVLWVIHTHAFDAAYSTPYLYVYSAEKQSGKTRVIEVLSTLARHATVTASVSSAAMYRLISEDRPTLFIDEVDAVFTGAANEDLRGVLNSGYKRNGSVMRFTGKDTESFSTFCPKLLAGIDNGAMPDTIADRCIPIRLKRKRAGVDVERFMWRKVEADAMALAEDIRQWAAVNMDALYEAEPAIIDDISDRAFEIAEPLLAIADRLGTNWRIASRKALAELLTRDDKRLSVQAQVLEFARDWFAEHRHDDRIPSSAIMQHFGLNGKKLGTLLAPFEITPSTLSFNGKYAKGYMRRDFVDAWERYL